MDYDEQIQAHILSVWRERKRLISVVGFEGMLFLTNKHVMFVTKTQAKMKWWQAATQRQVLTLTKSDKIMIHHDGYKEDDLKLDLENKKNTEISFDKILDISNEEKAWGSILNLEFLNKKGKKDKFQFSVVRDWVRYPVKGPTKYMKVDWSDFVHYIKDRQKITK